MGRHGCQHFGSGPRAGQRPAIHGGGSIFSIKSILNIVNQINISFNFAFGGGSLHNSQLNGLTMQSTM
jgi:hypothetical protein